MRVIYKSDDGKDYDTEMEALSADSKYWKGRAQVAENHMKGLENARQQQARDRGDPSTSSYGFSGGGGHD